jgi:hypothetical protein
MGHRATLASATMQNVMTFASKFQNVATVASATLYISGDVRLNNYAKCGDIRLSNFATM